MSTAAAACKAVAPSEPVTVAKPTNKSMPALLNDQEAAFEAQLDKDFFQGAGKGKKAKLTKAEKRGFNKKRMGEMLKENVIFGKQYRTGPGYNKKTKQKYNCKRIMGYVLRDEDASDDDEE